MGYRTLEVTLISAKDLNDVNVFSKMNVYAVVSIAGDQRSRQRTAADRVGGKSPSWNATLRFFVPATADVAGGLVLHVLLRSERVLGDRDVGEVHIPLKELLDAPSAAASNNNPGHFVSYQVRKPSSGKPKGILNLSYSFVDVPEAPAAAPPIASYSFPANKTYFGYLDTAYPTVPAYPPPGAYPPAGTHLPPAASELKHGDPAGSSAGYPPPEKKGKESKAGGPVTAYPYAAPAYPAPGAYPPPVAYPQPPGGYSPYQVPYGYTPGMPLAGHGHGAPPPSRYGYGAPPAVQKPKKGMGKAGLGMGLLGGALGGLLIGDMMADAAEVGSCGGDGF